MSYVRDTAQPVVCIRYVMRITYTAVYSIIHDTHTPSQWVHILNASPRSRTAINVIHFIVWTSRIIQTVPCLVHTTLYIMTLYPVLTILSTYAHSQQQAYYICTYDIIYSARTHTRFTLSNEMLVIAVEGNWKIIKIFIILLCCECQRKHRFYDHHIDDHIIILSLYAINCTS